MLFILPQLLALALTAMVGAFAWRNRREPGALPYALVTVGQSIWLVGNTIEMLSGDFNAKVFWDNVQYVGSVVWLVALFAFSAEFTGMRLRKRSWVYVGLAIPAVFLTAYAFLHPLGLHVRPNAHLVSAGTHQALIYDIPALIYAYSAYSVLVYLVSFFILLRSAMRPHPLFRMQASLVAAGNLVPLIGTFLSITLLRDSPYRDVTPYTVVFSNLFIGLGLAHYRLFEIVPLARDIVVESLGEPVIVLDPHNRILDLNRAAHDFLGAEQRPLIGRAIEELHETLPGMACLCTNELDTQTEVQTPAEPPRYLDVRIRLISGRPGRIRGRVIIVRDVTEHRLAEKELRRHRDNLEEMVRERSAQLSATNEQLSKEIEERQRIEAQYHQAEKMEAIGRLAGGVAHDYNNLLTVIMGHVDLMSGDNGDYTLLPESLEVIRSVTAQAAGLTQQLLTFSRKQVIQPVNLDLNAVLENMRKMLGRLIGEDIQLRIQTESNLGIVLADPVQVQQVIMNLVINARDAMPRGGELTIETSRVQLDEQCINTDLEVRSGPYILLSVKDTGIGMPREVQERIFEPFFTTKGLGKGTGLGLATVHGIVKQNNGAIHVYSEPGMGTAFRIYLPRIDAVEQLTVPRAAPPAEARKGETILVVEDEAFVLTLVRRVLSQAGYRVLEADNPQRALSLVQGYPHRIDLLLTDVVLPGGLTGRDLASELTTLNPALRVLFMSGYTEDTIARHGILNAGIHFLSKPFTPTQIRAKVREVIDSNIGDGHQA